MPHPVPTLLGALWWSEVAISSSRNMVGLGCLAPWWTWGSKLERGGAGTLAGCWKNGTRDTNLSDREIVLKSKRKPYCHVKDWSHHISMTVSVKMNCRKILSMTSNTLLLQMFLITYNRFQEHLGDLLRFKP